MLLFVQMFESAIWESAIAAGRPRRLLVSFTDSHQRLAAKEYRS
jgi:hypothetical protein